MTRDGRGTSGVVTLLTAGCVAVAGAAVAAAVAGRGSVDVAASAGVGAIDVSRDGRTWGPALAEPLLDPGLRWVPGDERGATIHVRHRGEGAGDLVVTVRLVPRDGASWPELEVAVRADDGTWRTGADAVSTVRTDVPSGRGVAVDVRAALDDTADGASRRRVADVEVDVRFAGSAAAAARTSEPVGTPALLAGGILALAAGAAVAGRGRRSEVGS